MMNLPTEITLMDWFAGQVLASGVIDRESLTISECANELGIAKNDWRNERDWPKVRALKAYVAAQAMMEIRQSFNL